MTKTKLNLLIIALLTVIGISIAMQVALPELRGAFYGNLVDKDPMYITSFCIFIGWLFVYYIADSLSPLIRGSIGLYLRNWWINKILSKKYLCYGDNTDGRISEDIRTTIDISFSLLVDFIIAACSIIGLVLMVPHELTMWAFGYTVGVTLISIVFNKPLITSQYDVQASEQSFRILIRKDMSLSQKVTAGYTYVCTTTMRCLYVMTGFRSFVAVKGLLASIIPFFVLIPIYMKGDIKFETLIQGVSTFDLLVSNTTIIVNSYPAITKALASYRRVKEL